MNGKIDEFQRKLTIKGDLTAEQRQRLLEIAHVCPIHRTLHSEVKVRTTLADRCGPSLNNGAPGEMIRCLWQLTVKGPLAHFVRCAFVKSTSRLPGSKLGTYITTCYLINVAVTRSLLNM